MFQMGIIYFDDTLTGASHLTKFCFQLTRAYKGTAVGEIKKWETSI